MINRIQDGPLKLENTRNFGRGIQAWMFSKEGLPHYIGMELTKKDDDRNKSPEMKQSKGRK